MDGDRLEISFMYYDITSQSIKDTSFSIDVTDTDSYLLPEINDTPNRKEAAPSYNSNIRKKINEVSKSNLEDEKLYKNLGDNLNHQHMMRNFHSMPNTSVPNNQKDFAMFCYGSMKSCKEGDETACSKNGRRLGNVPY